MATRAREGTPTDEQVLHAFESVRRAQRDGQWAPHKPLLMLLALARVQRDEPRLVAFSDVDAPMKALLKEFGPSSAPGSRHYPFWHLQSDGDGAVWQLNGPAALLARPKASTPNLGELRSQQVMGGFTEDVDRALRRSPALLRAAARRVLDAFFPATLHDDIAAAVGLDLAEPLGVPLVARDSDVPAYGEAEVSVAKRAPRSPAFRERVLRAYEYRCCVCGFDLRIGTVSAGLEAAHIQWHQAGGPDIEPNGLALCALHHKLFDLGAFTVEPGELRVVFSQHAIAGDRGTSGELRWHRRPLHKPQDLAFGPASEFLAWNEKHVFKKPARAL